ncbi:MAG: CRISPR-associated endoribonuclease Cas6 [Cytophagaceae bacterium]|jgi:CRISPR-associated endoribonuclease Cas6|nr:CRISPR-associated endoribonuclease Cas6 [Cytophagaceae bacterium]
MRIILKLKTKGRITLPYNYQSILVSALHKWLGKDNAEHESVSLYSFSWIRETKSNERGITLTPNSHWFINAHDPEVIKRIIAGIQSDNLVTNEVFANEIHIQSNPEFGTKERFSVANPVFIKRRVNDEIKFFFKEDPDSEKLLTETLVTKLKKAGLPSDGIKVSFDDEYPAVKHKGFTYKNIFNKGTICPVIIEGSPEQITFAWNVGVGNSTGIGFGALI